MLNLLLIKYMLIFSFYLAIFLFFNRLQKRYLLKLLQSVTQSEIILC